MRYVHPKKKQMIFSFTNEYILVMLNQQEAISTTLILFHSFLSYNLQQLIIFITNHSLPKALIINTTNVAVLLRRNCEPLRRNCSASASHCVATVLQL